MTETPEEALVELAWAGDKEAFDELTTRYYSRIYGYTLKFLHNPAEAEDMTQETFLAAWLQMVKAGPGLRWSSWLYTIAKNRCRDLLQHASRRLTTPWDDELHLGLRVSGSPEKALIRKEELAEVYATMSRELLPQQINALSLYYLGFGGGWNMHEVASTMDLDRKNLKTRLWRGRQRFQRHWKRKYGDQAAAAAEDCILSVAEAEGDWDEYPHVDNPPPDGWVGLPDIRDRSSTDPGKLVFGTPVAAADMVPAPSQHYVFKYRVRPMSIIGVGPIGYAGSTSSNTRKTRHRCRVWYTPYSGAAYRWTTFLTLEEAAEYIEGEWRNERQSAMAAD